MRASRTALVGQARLAAAADAAAGAGHDFDEVVLAFAAT